MPSSSSSQPYSRSRPSSNGTNSAPPRISDQHSGLFRANSSSSDLSLVASTQPAPSSSSHPHTANNDDQAALDEAAARKARRQKRREEEAYHIRGWEDLYGGGGGKPVFSRAKPSTHRSHPASSNAAAAAAASSSSTQLSASDINGRRKRTFSHAQSSSAKRPLNLGRRSPLPSMRSTTTNAAASDARLPPTIPPMPSTSSTTDSPRPPKRKAPSPSPSNTTREVRAPPRQTPVIQEEDSDDDFRIISFSGPAAKRFRAGGDDGDAATVIKPSPSQSASPLKQPQPTPSNLLRRSVSRAPSTGPRPSPSVPSHPPDHERPSSESASTSRETSPPRASRASSTSGKNGTGTGKLTPHEVESLSESAYEAFLQGRSLPDHISNIVHAYTDHLSAHHPDRPAIEQFQRRLAELGPRLTINEIRLATPALPSRLAKRFRPVLTAYVRYLKRDQNADQSNAAPPESSVSASADTAVVTDAAGTSQDRNQASEVEKAPTANADAPAEVAGSELTQRIAPCEPQQPSTKGAASAATAEEPDVDKDKSTNVDLPVHTEAEPDDSHNQDEEVADAGHASTVDSAGSPQAFGTPPEEPEVLADADEAGEAIEPQGSAAPAQAEMATDGEGREEDEEEDELVDELIDELNADNRGVSEDSIQANETAQTTAVSQPPASTDPSNGEERTTDVEPAADTDQAADNGHQAGKDQDGQEAVGQSKNDDQPRIQGANNLGACAGDEVEQHNQQQFPSPIPGSSSGPARADDTNDAATDHLEPGSVRVADQVATAVEEALEALGVSTAASSMRPADTTSEAPAAEAEAEAEARPSANEPQDAQASGQTDAMVSQRAATPITPPLPPLVEPRPSAESSVSQNASPHEQAPPASTGTALTQNAPPVIEPAGLQTDLERLASPAAEAAVAPETLVPAREAGVEARAATAEPSVDPSIASTETGGERTGSVAPSTTEDPADANPSLRASAITRATSQPASDSASTRRPKTIDDNMRSLLGNLANVTGRKSSYKTIQKLKPRRAGLSTPQTIPDLVEHWQDPAKMIPWQCLEEIGPDVLHKRAHRHMKASMHELMDRVSDSKAVRHLLAKVPERVMVRALMEFPRIPHMVQCWSHETEKYFASRQLARPKDVRPQFRYADGGLDRATPAAAALETSMTRASAPPLSTASPEVSERKLGPEASGMAVMPASLPASTTRTQSDPAQGQTPSQLQVAPSNVQQQRLLAAGAQLLAAHIAQQVQGLQQRGSAQSSVLQPTSAQLSLSVLEPNRGEQRALEQLRENVRRNLLERQRLELERAEQARLQALEARLREQALEQQRRRQREQQAARLAAQQAEQLRAQQASSAAAQAALIKQTVDRVFSGLAADCLSFAEHVIGSGATDELSARDHFSEADVLHVVRFVVGVYGREVEAERAAGHDNVRAEERYARILGVQTAAEQVVHLTKTLLGVKMCLNEAASESLRRSRGASASTDAWRELLATRDKWRGIKEYLLRDHPRADVLSRNELNVLLQRQVDLVNKELETTLERMMEIDALVGHADPAAEEGEGDEAIQRECYLIAGICCKHVVGMLGDAESSTR